MSTITARKFTTLYKQTNTGKIQSWVVSVDGAKVMTTFGLTDGKKQTTTDIVKAGKNLGKSNATTPESQAVAQAQQEFDGKLKEGYVANLTAAMATKNTRGAVEPMLAFPIEKKEKYAVFPALAQPKLDGLRCIAIIESGEVRLFSRTQKPILTMPHIVEELGRLYPEGDIILDGELYADEFADDFNSITHLAKRSDVHEDHTKIGYHVYDVVGPECYRDRAALICAGKYIFPVETIVVGSREELDAYQADCVARGYEGCMYRNPAGAYENKRSPYLLKVKTFVDDEFRITGAEEGAGKLMGAVGAFVLITKEGVTFKAKPQGTLAQSQAYWRDRAKLVGKFGTVKYQGKTPDGSLRFPSFKCVREG